MVAFTFDKPQRDFRPGDIFIGKDGKRLIGIEAERNLVTFGGAGMGKTSGLLIPNAKLYAQNLLVIDPKGEIAEAVWRERKRMGQRVVVLDPFKVCNVPDELRGTFNPLDLVEEESNRAREDLLTIAEANIVRYDQRAGHWDEGGKVVAAGFLAHVLTIAKAENRNLTTMKDVLAMCLKEKSFKALRKGMAANTRYGALAQSAALRLGAFGGESKHFLSVVAQSFDWLSSTPMADMLQSSNFDIRDLKLGKLDLFLVLPPGLIDEHARFLRLFVQMALWAMETTQGPRKCLFMLDEFYSLGHLTQVAKAAGLMRSYGARLWPCMQGPGQLMELYGQEGHQTFFENADAAIFLGVQYLPTAKYVSERIGVWKADELAEFPPFRDYTRVPFGMDVLANSQPTRPNAPHYMPMTDRNGKIEPAGVMMNGFQAMSHSFGELAYEAEMARVAYARAAAMRIREAQAVEEHNAEAAYNHLMRNQGTPRVPPDEVIRLTGKGEGEKVARGMIVFGKAGEVYNLRPMPFFRMTDEDRLRAGGLPEGWLGTWNDINTDIRWSGSFDAISEKLAADKVRERVANDFGARLRMLFDSDFRGAVQREYRGHKGIEQVHQAKHEFRMFAKRLLHPSGGAVGISEVGNGEGVLVWYLGRFNTWHPYIEGAAEPDMPGRITVKEAVILVDAISIRREFGEQGKPDDPKYLAELRRMASSERIMTASERLFPNIHAWLRDRADAAGITVAAGAPMVPQAPEGVGYEPVSFETRQLFWKDYVGPEIVQEITLPEAQMQAFRDYDRGA